MVLGSSFPMSWPQLLHQEDVEVEPLRGLLPLTCLKLPAVPFVIWAPQDRHPPLGQLASSKPIGE